MTVREAYLHGREHLAACGSEEAALEAEVLLRHALGTDRTGLYTRWEGELPAWAWERYRAFLDQRARGRPVAYIVGHREFWGLTFAVDERVLIPRPETEVVVEAVLDHLAGRADPVVVDVGTGSGCVAVSLAVALPQATVYATDISPGAVEVARANAARHGVGRRVVVLVGDLLQPLPAALAGRVDAVVSNPPYIAASRWQALPATIRDHEPPVALVAGPAGTEVHARLIAASAAFLAPHGLLALEVAPDQADAVAALARESGRYGWVQVRADYGGAPRVVLCGRALSPLGAG
jgi:release factor glutamine methyltransferase